MPFLANGFDHGIDVLEGQWLARFDHPHAVFFEHRGLFTNGPKNELVPLAFDFQGIAGRKMVLVPQFLGDDHTSRFIKCELGRHNGKCKWYFPFVNGIF